jgi:citrate lyase beta subunit
VTRVSTSLTAPATRAVLARLKKANAAFADDYPGDLAARQPVHTVYGGAHLFHADTAARLGERALRALKEYAPDAGVFSRALGLSVLADTVYERVLAKLEREPVEDYRIDFEDGYGHRPDEEEDAEAHRTAEEMAKGMAASSLPPFVGIRVKPLSEELHQRAVRTLDVFVTTLARSTKGQLPANFVVTLPKVAIPEQVEAASRVCGLLEKRLGLRNGALRLELMIETPQALFGRKGQHALLELVAAGHGRCRGVHFGAYDYTAALDVTAAHQAVTHPACDFARHVLQASLAGTGIAFADSPTLVMPVPPHRAPSAGVDLSTTQIRENRLAVHRAWKTHFDNIQHSLRHAYYQGWDLHPAQLPTRYAALYSFFLEGLDAVARRLRGFIEGAAQASLVGGVFDDAATGQGLLNFFLRGLACGALTPEEASRSGLTVEEIRSRSFLWILQARRGA